MWDQLELTPAHLTYLVLTLFLLTYALFGEFIRNRLHLSEPPLATVVGIILGPYVLKVITPRDWGLGDNLMQEITRVVVGVQCFTIGIELPKLYFHRHWKSVAVMLGPVMSFSFLITSVFAHLLFQCDLATSFIIGACLSPTDPVLAASVVEESKFANRVPKRIKDLLAAESACNDGVSFPFLYVGIVMFTQKGGLNMFKEWALITILWQCAFGLMSGLALGWVAKHVLRFADKRDLVGRPSFVVFYLLLAILALGLGSCLGSDDFLVAFGAGVGFATDGWFSAKTKSTRFPEIVDLVLNATMFVYFGSDIPFSHFTPSSIAPHVGLWQLFVFLILVLLFRRIPIVLLCKKITPDIRTWREALFCGHFGPMGVGALFLAIEARAQLERSKSIPLPEPPHVEPPYTDRERAVEIIWPVITFVVLGSIMVHGLSVAAITISGHYSRKEGERAPLIGGETEGLEGMEHEGGGGESEPEVSTDEE